MNSPTKAADEKFCLECAAVIKARAVICPACGCPQSAGSSQTSQGSSSQQKSKNTAGILAFVLGNFGAHKFYLDQPGWGVLYLLLCFTFLPAIMGVIEAIGLFGMSGEEFDRRYNG